MGLLNPGFDTGTYVLTRTGGTVTIDAAGHTVMPGSTVVPGGVTGSLQPVTGITLEDIKEGKRGADERVLFTYTPMYTTDQGHAQQDFVDIPDEVDNSILRRYRVKKVEYFGVISKHYRVTLEKVAVP